MNELENKNFQFSNGDEYYIEKALQTIEFEIDKKGGKIKSEAGMMVNKAAIIADEPREFLVDDTFTIFLKEKDKELPYFAARISDISKVQEDVKEKTEQVQYTKITDANLQSDLASTDILVKYNGILYGKSYGIIDYAGDPNEYIGKIDKLIDKEYVPELDGETNTEEILNALVSEANEEIMVLYYNGEFVMFDKIDR